MYTPSAFALNDLAAVHALIEEFSFAALVSGSGESLVASHLPLLLDPEAGPYGTLRGHFAKANPQAASAAGQPVLAVFSGPHAYISPTWYAARQVVPTWNYVAVHAYGTLELLDSPAAAEALLRQTIDRYERSQPVPWRLDESPEFVARLVAQITAFEIRLDRLEGKHKLSQNQPAERRQKVIAALAQQPGDNAAQLAARMQALESSGK